MLAAWVDGMLADAVALDDRGLHYGDGLFETIAATGGRACFLGAHLARLARGCSVLSMPAPDPQVLQAEVARAAGLAPHVIVKLIVTRGAARQRGYGYSGNEVPRRIVCAYAWPEGPAVVRAPARIALAAAAVGRPLCPGVKHLNRLEQVLARAEAQRRGLDEVILHMDEGLLSGGSMTNLFALVDGRLVTPPVEHCRVAGVMRAQLLAAAPRLGLPTCERPMRTCELAAAQALWLTNVRLGLWPVAACDGRESGVNAWTSRLQRALRAAAGETPGA